MTTIAKSGHEIVRAIRSGCAGKGLVVPETDSIGKVSSFCEQIRVDQTNPNQIDIVSVATTDDIDMDKEVLLPDGVDWTYLKKMRVLYLEHELHAKEAVATLRNVTRQGKGWVCRATLLNDPMNENVRTVKTLAEAGALGMSIGYTVQDGGKPTADEARLYPGAKYIIRRCKALELSYTTIPCNVECQTQAVIYGSDSKRSTIVDILTKSRTPAALMESMGLVRRVTTVVCCG